MSRPIPERLAAIDWANVSAALDAYGCALTGPLLTRGECARLIESYRSETPEVRFRSRIVMAQHGFGRGQYQYQYFDYPLPPVVEELRSGLYPPLARIANRWNEVLDDPARFPADHPAYRKLCHGAGQTKPTPLLLQYGPGDYNCLHQDIYGELVFPLQVTILSFEAGNRFQGRGIRINRTAAAHAVEVEAVPLAESEGGIFPVHHRPVHGTRGVYRVTMRHGVSRLRSGHRHTLGVLFHDAR